MKICIAGGTGFIGSAVKEQAEKAGHEITLIHIPRPEKKDAHNPEAWESALEAWQPDTFSGYDALMIFGGESIGSRWSDRKKQRIELSRQMPSRRMAWCASQAGERPKSIISASAVGYYGNRGDELLTEESDVGAGYLATTTATWEATWEAARASEIRVVLLRFGIVLDPLGGPLRLMLPAFRAGAGGPMGNGRQWMSWINLSDAARLAVWALEHETISGPVNAVSPEPVRQADFARALGQAVHRPAVVQAPRFALRALFGDMADEALLSSCRAVPARAAEAGFHFNRASLQECLRGIK